MLFNDMDTIPHNGSPQVYTVREGDTLESISEQFYGVPHLWDRIMNANKCHRCRNGVPVGRELVIPQ